MRIHSLTVSSRLVIGMLAFSVPMTHVRAQEEPASSSEAEVVEVYKSENVSSFDLSDEVRSPFWPIGWEPSAKVEKPRPKAPKPLENIPPNLFRLSSTLTGKPAIAIIDGRDYMVGQSMEKSVQNQTVKFRVVAIRDGLVVLSYAGGTVTIRNN